MIRKRHYIICACLWILSFICIAFIFSNSLQNGTSSGQTSGTVMNFINSVLGSISPSLKVDHHFVRKAAHFCEFAALSLSFCFSFWFTFSATKGVRGKRRFMTLFSIPASFAVAVCDEVIQLFIDGRSGSVTDVLIDTSGAVTSALLFFALYTLICRLHKKKQTAGCECACSGVKENDAEKNDAQP